MTPNVSVVFKDVEHNPALSFTIHKKLEKLTRYSKSIVHSKVILDSPNNGKSKSKLYRASIELGLKGAPVLVTHDDFSVHIALRDAFSSAERKLKEVSRQSKH